MNINDYKDVNGNVLVSETLVSDIIDGINGVVESGSNANGRYIRFSDGTMICYGVVIKFASFSAIGSVYRSGLLSISFPATFINTNIAGAVNDRDNNSLVTFSPDAATYLSCRVIKFISSNDADISLNFIAIGRWK